MTSLRELSVKYPDLLIGQKKETDADLLAVETALSVQLPEDVKWYLLECGYGAVNAIPNIRSSIADTLRFRNAIGLNARYVVLSDMGYAGVVLLDTRVETGAVLWMDWRVAGLLPNGGDRPEECERFESFSAWVVDRTEDLLCE